MEDKSSINTALVGLQCTNIAKWDHSWNFLFGTGKVATNLHIECPWRLLVNDAIAFGYDDHGQQFGLPEPVDGVERIGKLLLSSPVISATLRTGPGDLVIVFQSGVCLEIFNASCGYEGWQCSNSNGSVVVAQGGGNLSCWEQKPL